MSGGGGPGSGVGDGHRGLVAHDRSNANLLRAVRPAGERVVLLAEDDGDMAELYSRSLGLNGFLVVIAENGARAIELAAEISPDVVCLDVQLPNLDGLEVLVRLRNGERTGSIPVIMISNFDEPELMERAGRLGAVRFLVKLQTPPTDLVDIVTEVLQLPERRKPGRLPISLGPHPAQEAEQMIAAYRDLLDTANSILSELAPNADERRRELSGYVSQFRAQLAYWHAVMQRADDMTLRVRASLARP